jgi:hypothetical protein
MKGLLDGDLAVAPKRIKPRGKKPHALAYIDPEEAALLRSRGGGVAPGGGQIMRHGLPSFEDGGDGGDGGAGDGGGDGPGAGGDGPGGPNDNGGASATGEAAGPGMGGVDGPGGMGNEGDGTAEGGSNGSHSEGGYGGGGGYRGGGWGEPPPWWGAAPPGFTPQLGAQPVYTQQPQAPVIPPALQGTTPGGFLAGQDAFRALAGYQRPTLPPQPPVAPPPVPQPGAWAAPPPLRPLSPYPQAPILTGRGGNDAYYGAMQRLAPSEMPMGYFDTLARYRRW